MEEEDWYYASPEGQIGPLTFIDFKTKWVDKCFHSESLIWSTGMDSWAPVKESLQIFEILQTLTKASEPKRKGPPPLPPVVSKVNTPRPSPAVVGTPPRVSPAGSANPKSTSPQPRPPFNKTSAAKPAIGPLSFNKPFPVKSAPITPPLSTSPPAPTSTALVPARPKPTPEQLGDPREWEERRTVDNVSYYYNGTRDQLSWDRPLCMYSERERAEKEGRWVWVKSSVEGWVPIEVTKTQKDGQVIGTTRAGNQLTAIPEGDVYWDSLRMLTDDIVLLEDVNEPSILYTIKERYMQNKIYTWIGSNKSLLLLVNPFQQLPLYSPEQINIHANPPPNHPIPPHVYDIAHNAYMELKLEGTNQAILISGESGAGKTEATKQCLGFITEIAGSDSTLEQKIMMTNPVLEAFGNAKTVRNNNSSRFGKWIEVHFDEDNQVCGTFIESYLLEKSRVVFQQKGERNFHIFYQVLSYTNISAAYNLLPAREYRYLYGGECVDVGGMNDKDNFAEVLDSLQSLGFELEDQKKLWDLLVSILCLGNLKFRLDNSNSQHPMAKVVNTDMLKKAADLLCVPAIALEEAVTTRRLSVREGFVQKNTFVPLNAKEAADNCDALAKEIYAKMFDWIVEKLNEVLKGRRNKFIGFLDIFGFEIFDFNSFEQLCINYANEQLQQLFNRSTFKEEETVYSREGVEYQHIEFIDNTEVLALLEDSHTGIFMSIIDQVRLRNGNDTQLLKEMKQKFNNHSCFDTRNHDNDAFSIKHYAGNVCYHVTGFTDKNRDKIFDNLYELVSKSQDKFISTLFPPQTDRSMTVTVISKFVEQLKALISIMDTSERKYIRCIKPNDFKKKLNFESVHCLEQMRCSGVFEAVKIRKIGYPYRRTLKGFVHRYNCLVYHKRGLDHPIPPTMSINDQIQLIVQARTEIAGKLHMGRTLVLYRAKEHKLLELARNLALEQLIPTAQALIKRRFYTFSFPLFFNINSNIERVLATRNLDLIQRTYDDCQQYVSCVRMFIGCELAILRKAEESIYYLKHIREITTRINLLVNEDVAKHHEELLRLLQQAQRRPELMSNEVHTLVNTVKTALRQFAAGVIEPDLKEALAILARPVLVEICEKAIALDYTSEQVEKAKEIVALPMEQFIALEIKCAEDSGDYQRLVDRKIELRSIMIKRAGDDMIFVKFPRLKSGEEYASRKILKLSKKKLVSGVYVFNKGSIHTCITTMPKDSDKLAIMLFKYVQGFMKDRKYNQSQQAITVDICRLLHSPDATNQMKTELFCQVIKQLSSNPSEHSQAHGLDMLSVLMYYVLPEEEFINYLIYFIQSKAPENRKMQMLSILNDTYFSSKYLRDDREFVCENIRCPPKSEADVTAFLNKIRDVNYTVPLGCCSKAAERSAGLKPLGFAGSRSPQSPKSEVTHQQKLQQLSEIGEMTQAVRRMDASSAVVSNAAVSNAAVSGKAIPATSQAGGAGMRVREPVAAVAAVVYAEVMFDITSDIGDFVLVCNEGDKIVLEEECGEWYRASFSGKEGFVPINYVQKL